MLHESLLADLKASGLVPEDINARAVTPSELAACNVPANHKLGYVIPYYNFKGEPLPYYRLKLKDYELKYKQPKDSANHIYFPPNFLKVLSTAVKEGHKYVLITEGEKKAAASCKAGIAAVGLGGVDSWRNRTLILPADTKLENDIRGKENKVIKAKLPSTKVFVHEDISVAQGFSELVDLVVKNRLTLIIAFDSDIRGTVKPQVQRAAAMLGYELRYRGIPTDRIKQLILPEVIPHQKSAVDDYICIKGKAAFIDLVGKCARNTKGFPRHPNPKEFINNRLESGINSRKEAQEVSMSILTELDHTGRRLRDAYTHMPYYFDEGSFKLMKVSIGAKASDPLHESPFGNYLYQNFGIGQADGKVMSWLATQFTGEPPVNEVKPRRVMCLTKDDPQNPDGIAFQVSDSEFIEVTPDPKKPYHLRKNGSCGILFEQGNIVPMDSELILETFEEQIQPDYKMECWWYDVYKDINLGGQHNNYLASLLCYVAPWLQRWRGLQLPIEITTGEAGSGKSSLYDLRLRILTGVPNLRNSPTDLRDWYASITSTGGLHMIDNVVFVDKVLRQRMSDEICRLITAPIPEIEQRKLYTTGDIYRVPVDCTFAMTGIQMPFQNGDLIQRAVVFNIEKTARQHDGDWVAKQLEHFGGREAWIGHHLAFLHRFLRIATTKWDPEYRSTHRLAHFEQVLGFADQVFNHKQLPALELNIVQTLDTMVQKTLEGSDEALEGLKAFAAEWISCGNEPFDATVVASWAQAEDEYRGNPLLTNARKIGKYISSHKHALEKTLRLKEVAPYGNRRRYQFQRVKE